MSDFIFDDRDIRQRLEWFYGYAKQIPFMSNTSQSWADVIFNDGMTVEQLASIYNDPTQAQGELDPLQALLLAFMKTSEVPVALMNRLPEKFRTFYYQDYVGMTPAPGTGDTVVLSIQAEPDEKSVLIARGTVFDGGQDTTGAPLLYASDVSIRPSAGTLERIFTADALNSTAPKRVLLLDTNEEMVSRHIVEPLFSTNSIDIVQALQIGRIIFSDALGLSDGTRTFTITLSTDTVSTDLPGAEDIQADISTTDGWLPLVLCSSDDNNTFVFELPGSAPAISAYPALSKDIPALRIYRTDGVDVPPVEQISARVQYSRNLIISNDNSSLDIHTVDVPFDMEPVVGSKMLLIHPDWCDRSCAVNVTLTPEWTELPDIPFSEWYAGYPVLPSSNSDFTVAVYLNTPAGGHEVNGSDAPQPLFTGSGVPEGTAITFTVPAFFNAMYTESDYPEEWKGWISIELLRNFGHGDYRNYNGTSTLNVPWTPMWQSCNVEYQINIASDAFEQYQISPGGGFCSQSDLVILPTVYFGFSGVRPSDELSLYLHLREGQPLAVQWEYIDQSGAWKNMTSFVDDGSRGMSLSGLIKLNLPADIATSESMMLDSYYWVRCFFTENKSKDANAVPVYASLVDVQFNAITATLQTPDGVSAAHFEHGLPSGSIHELQDNVSGVRGVNQKYPSHGGCAAEATGQFNQRASIRMANKGRARLYIDAQELLLGMFRTIAALDYSPGSDNSLISKGNGLELVVVPYIGHAQGGLPYTPYFGEYQLGQIATFINTLCDMRFSLSVINPVYIDISIDAVISTDDGNNQVWLCEQAKVALSRYYMNWLWPDSLQKRGLRNIKMEDVCNIILSIENISGVNALTLNGASRDISLSFGQLPSLSVDVTPAGLKISLLISTNTQVMIADGETPCTSTLVVLDPDGHPLPGAKVTWSLSGGVVVDSSNTTDENGKAIITFTDAVAETVTVTAEVDAGSVGKQACHDTVIFTALQGELIFSPTQPLADGITPCTATLTVTDANGNPVQDAAVAWFADGNAEADSSVTSGTTGEDGKATFIFTDAVAETVTVTAIINGELTASADVAFSSPPLTPIEVTEISYPTAAEGGILVYTVTLSRAAQTSDGPLNLTLILWDNPDFAEITDIDATKVVLEGAVSNADGTSTIIDLSSGTWVPVNVSAGKDTIRVSVPVKTDAVVENNEQMDLAATYYVDGSPGVAVVGIGTITDAASLNAP